MSTDVYYWLGSSDGIRSKFLGDVKSFSEWLSVVVESCRDEFPEDYARLVNVLAKTLDIVQRGRPALTACSAAEANLIDEVVDEYFDWRALTGSDYLKHESGGCLRWYPIDLTTALPNSSICANHFYKKLFVSKAELHISYSLAEFPWHRHRDPFFSWLLPAEVAALRAELEPFEPQLERNSLSRLLSALRKAEQQGASLVVHLC